MTNLKQRYETVQARLRQACLAAHREYPSVALLAVSKKHPTSAIHTLYTLGQRKFGENYVSEAMQKIHELRTLDIEWHFIGPLQSNKTRQVAEAFAWVQSVDKEKLVHRLGRQRPADKPPLNLCIQVNIDREEQKAGCLPEQVNALARLCADYPALQLRGLMALPRIDQNATALGDSFSRMRKLFAQLLESGYAVDTLSMGMSADLETAIGAGSTMVRIGTDLFGPRN